MAEALVGDVSQKLCPVVLRRVSPDAPPALPAARAGDDRAGACWKDCPAHFALGELHVRNAGRLAVGFDAPDNTTYDQVVDAARNRHPWLLATLARRCAEAEGLRL